MGDFNLTIENKHLQELLSLFNIKSLISPPTCFQSINPTCIKFNMNKPRRLV